MSRLPPLPHRHNPYDAPQSFIEASFSEKFYNLKRAPLSNLKARLTFSNKLRSLVGIVFVPYVKDKLDKYYEYLCAQGIPSTHKQVGSEIVRHPLDYTMLCNPAEKNVVHVQTTVSLVTSALPKYTSGVSSWVHVRISGRLQSSVSFRRS